MIHLSICIGLISLIVLSLIILFFVFNAEVSDLFLWCYWKLHYLKNLISTSFSYIQLLLTFAYMLAQMILYIVNSDLFEFIMSQLPFTTEPGIDCLIKICLFKFISQCYYLPNCAFMWWRVSKYLRTSLIMLSIVNRMKFWLSCCPPEWREVF